MWGIRFEIRAPFGHFRNPYTTTLKQTYPFPPKTTVIGMIGAMLGWSENEVIERMDEFKIAIPFWQNRGKFIEFTFIISVGKLKTTRQREEFRPERFEILLYPKYQIIILHSDKHLIEEISHRIKRKDFEYPIYMGKNEFIISNIVLLKSPSEYEIDKVKKVKGIVFKEGNLIPKFEIDTTVFRPPEVFIGVPKSLQIRNGKREQKEVCVALATQTLIELIEPQDGIRDNDGEYTTI